MVANDLITTKEAGLILGVEASRVRQLILSGDLKAEKIGEGNRSLNLIPRSNVLILKKTRQRKSDKRIPRKA